MKPNPNDPMTPEVFAEAIKLWHERGEPTKKNEAKRLETLRRFEEKRIRQNAYDRDRQRRKREALKNDPYGQAGQDGT